VDEPVDQPDGTGSGPFRVTFVTGVTPDKWAGRWASRQPTPLELVPVAEEEQLDALRRGEAAMAFVRLPVDREGLHAIPLYTEDAVVVVSREHPVAAYDEIALADLADEHLLQDPDAVPAWRDLATEVREGTRHPVPPMTLAQVVESVAAQAGIAVLPRSVARVHHRKDVVPVLVTDLDGTQVALVWHVAAEDPRIEEFIGIVRGRTERSSRGAAEPAEKPRKKAAPRPGVPRGRATGGRGGRGSSGRGGRRGRR
jgi:DNA-binding transcriptional LysR family regulator